MKLFIFILLAITTIAFAQDVPIAGKTYTINYTPPEGSKLTDSEKISVVYVFDFWGTSNTYSQGASGLFLNVMAPDSGRANSIEMEKKENVWSVKIEIPNDAALLSYYFTDGDYFDYNNKKTFLSYIYNENKKPVKNAHFRNVDFLLMAEESNEMQIAEIENEIKEYPDNFVAYVPYWRMKFEQAKTLNELIKLRKEFENQFINLKSKIGETDSLLVAEASVYYTLPRFYYAMIRPETESIRTKMMDLIIKIPEDKRGPYLSRYYEGMQKQKEGDKFSKEIIGKNAPEIEFTDIQGKKYKLSDFIGKYILLEFWGTWCGPCVSEIPNIKKVYKKFKEYKIEFISISNDLSVGSKTEEEFKKFIKENGMNWIQVLDNKEKILVDNYKISKFPTLFLIDKEGIILKVDEGLRGTALDLTLSKYINN